MIYLNCCRQCCWENGPDHFLICFLHQLLFGGIKSWILLQLLLHWFSIQYSCALSREREGTGQDAGTLWHLGDVPLLLVKNPSQGGIALLVFALELPWGLGVTWTGFIVLYLYFLSYWVEIGNRAEFNLIQLPACRAFCKPIFPSLFIICMNLHTLYWGQHLLRGSCEAPCCCSCPVPAPRKSDSGPVCISSLAVTV